MTAVLDSSLIVRLARDPAAVAAFPMLAAAVPKSGCCGKAGADPNAVRRVQRSIAAMGADARSRLKALIGAASVTVYVVRGNKIVPETF